MLQSMKNHKDDDNQSSRLLDNDQMDATANNADNDNMDENANTNTSSMLSSLSDLDQKEDGPGNDGQDEDAGDRRQSVNINLNVNDNEDGNINVVDGTGIMGKLSLLPLVSKWIYLFVGMGLLLVLEGIVYAIAYDKDDGD